jgi:hypothetical protein
MGLTAMQVHVCIVMHHDAKKHLRGCQLPRIMWGHVDTSSTHIRTPSLECVATETSARCRQRRRLVLRHVECPVLRLGLVLQSA